MSQPILFGVSPNLVNWLTPVWLLGVGAALGLVLLVVLWGVCAALSRLPAVGTLAESPRRHLAAGILTAAFFVVLAAVLLWSGAPGWYEEGLGAVIGNGLFTLLWAALLSVLGGYGVVALVSRRNVAEVPMTVSEGPLLWVLVVTGAMALLGGAATLVVQHPLELLSSAARFPYTGRVQQSYRIPASRAPRGNVIVVVPTEEHTIPVAFRGQELRSLELRSNQPLEVSPRSFEDPELNTSQVIEVEADQPKTWFRGEQGGELFPKGPVRQLYVRNLGQSEARLNMTIVTAPVHPQVATIPVTALVVLALFLAYFLQRSLAPRLSAIALSTCKSEINQPMFIILLIVGVVALVIFIYVPYNTFGEDIKMLKDSGLTLILVFAIFQAIWAASKSISEEIEGRTALTVLSKPIGRREFILGKFLGIAWTIALMFLVLGTVFLVVVAYKPIYDAYERGAMGASWQECHREMVLIVPGLALALMEALVLGALSVAFSTRLSMLANFLTCGAIYVLGHLTPLMVQSSLNRFEIVTFVARLIATIFPVLDHFNIQAAVAGGASVPLAYLGWSLLYCLVYGTIAMLLALVMFEDRDLA